MPKVKSDLIKASVYENMHLIKGRGEELTGMVFIATTKNGRFYATIMGIDRDLKEAIGTAYHDNPGLRKVLERGVYHGRMLIKQKGGENESAS